MATTSLTPKQAKRQDSAYTAWLKHWMFRTGIDPVTWLVRLAIILILGFFFIIPLISLLLTTTKTNREILDLPWYTIGNGNLMVGIAYIGKAWGYLMQFLYGVMGRWIFNSFYYVFMGLALSISFAVPAGFTLAIIPFKLRRSILWLTLLVMLIPGDALVLPLYLELFYMKVLYTQWALIIPAMSFPMGVYMVFQYYKAVMPADLVAAAKVDGCTYLDMFWYIGLPLARNIIGTLGFIQFAALWGGFFAAQLYIDDAKLKPLSAGIAIIVSQCGGILPVAIRCIENPEGHTIQRAEIALLGVISTLPVLIIYALAQRMVIRGATAGAIKE
jgi:multiple sugar transport system permease protein